jgi:hypothetical protein
MNELAGAYFCGVFATLIGFVISAIADVLAERRKQND